MRRLKFTLFIIIGFFLNSIATGQALSQVRTMLRPMPSDELPTLQNDIKELRAFSAKVDQFIILVNDEQWTRADFIKSSIIRDMRDEIHQTRKKLEAFRKENRSAETGSDFYNKRESGNSTSGQRRSYSAGRSYDKSFELEQLENRLREQESLMRDFAATRLGYGAGAWERNRRHEKLMIRFEEILKEEIRLARDKAQSERK